LRSDEFALHLRFAIFQEHLDHFPKIALKLIERFTLRMRPRKPWHKADIKPRLRTTLNDSSEVLHVPTVLGSTFGVNAAARVNNEFRRLSIAAKNSDYCETIFLDS
jgi:hypothetical protein